jgi:hypothetical protein
LLKINSDSEGKVEKVVNGKGDKRKKGKRKQ